jgi:hypothetical protein
MIIKVWTATTHKDEPDEYEVTDYGILRGGILALYFVTGRELLISPSAWREVEIT